MGEMVLPLNCGTKPEGLNAVMSALGMGGGERILVGEYSFTMEDLLRLAFFALTSSNLDEDNDPRLQFSSCVRSLCFREGYPNNADGREVSTRRLWTEVAPVPGEGNSSKKGVDYGKKLFRGK